MKKQIEYDKDPMNRTAKALSQAGYMVCMGNRIVDSDRMGLANLNPDGSVSIHYHQDHLRATLKQLSLRAYSVEHGIPCQDEGLEEVSRNVRETHDLMVTILSTVDAINLNARQRATA